MAGPTLTGGGGTTTGSSSGSTVTPEQIWNDLLALGASATVAAGVMGNMIAESGLNPEANVVDSNGARSYGLMQWNAASYPGAASLVTGNPAADAIAQVNFFFSTVSQSVLTGSTPAQVAASIAANYERCSTCQTGGTSNSQRQSNATTVASWASSGNWPTTGPAAASNAASGQTSSGPPSGGPNDPTTSKCLWGQINGVPLLWDGFCLFSYGSARALIGVLLMSAAMLPGVLALALLAQYIPGVPEAEGGALGGLVGAIGGPETAAAGAAIGAEEGHKHVEHRQQRQTARKSGAPAPDSTFSDQAVAERRARQSGSGVTS